MVESQDIRGYINPFAPRQTESGQRAAMPPGAELYVENKTGKIIDRLIRSVRPGATVAIKDLDCLVPGNFNAQKRRRLLLERVEAIKERGGIIVEQATGRSSKTGHMLRMLTAAYDSIAKSGRGRRSAANGSLSTGAPPTWPRSGAVYEGYETIWRSRRFDNDDERMTAIKKRYGKSPSRVWLRQQFGSPHSKQPYDKD